MSDDADKKISYFYQRLAASQEPLGAEFQKVLDDNWWEFITDEDHESLGAMLHAMRPREDRKD